jgi:hypothetical protein
LNEREPVHYANSSPRQRQVTSASYGHLAFDRNEASAVS